MSDLISRQDAMEAVRKVWCNNDDRNDFKQKYYEMGNNDAVEDALGEIEKLPTVVASTEFLISRYDAKDKAKEIMYSILDDTDYNNIESMAHTCLMMKIKILKMFDALPSADAVQIPIKLEKRYPQSRNEDITDAFMRGYLAGRSSADRPTGHIVTKCSSKFNPTVWAECSECGKPIDAWDKFCRHCGAKMGGEEADENA